MATEEGFVCKSCIDAVVASAKVAGEEYENADYVHMLALKFGARISDHFCEDDDEKVDRNCGCRVGVLPWGESFGTVTAKGDVCDSCLEAVYEAALSVGESSTMTSCTHICWPAQLEGISSTTGAQRRMMGRWIATAAANATSALTSSD